MDRIILASASPRRKQLLEWAEVVFEIMPSDSDEMIPACVSVEEIPVLIAAQKAAIIRQKISDDAIILAADTIVELNGVLFGKPANRADAIRMLKALSGQTHRVITGVSISRKDQEKKFSQTTFVRFHSLQAAGIEHYVDNYQPYDKAGAYAIQEWIGVTGIHSIEGDFYNVMGLPVSRVLQELKNF